MDDGGIGAGGASQTGGSIMPKWINWVYLAIGALFAFFTVACTNFITTEAPVRMENGVGIGIGIASFGLAMISSTAFFLSSKKL